ncbi:MULTISPECIES: LPD38 domain-containing protein [unclassified Peribacillus]|uniref:LPD38 domain-containing protein n=1 Tax=unclassified Peribacillus TaxID=2675266 RepID=UPI00366CE4F4
MAKSAFQIWAENEKKRKASPKLSSLARRENPVQYNKSNYSGESLTRSKNYEWEKGLLKNLPSNYGRNYDKKFESWAASKGMDKSEAREFRTWMDSKEDEVDTKSRLTDGILNLSNRRTEERAKTITEHRPKREPEKKTGFAAMVDKLKKSEVGQTFKAAEDFFNPFDKVKAGDAMNNFLNHEQSDKTKEFARGANRATDSASLGLFSNLDKRLNDRDPAYNPDREFGEGGGTDMITSGLGYLVPGLGAAKAVKGAGLGAKAGATGLSRFGQIAREGAIAGAGVGATEVGIREGLNPDDYNYKQNLGHIGIGAAAGAIADPLLDGAGQLASNGLARLAKGEVPEFTGKPSEDILEQLRPQQSNRIETPHKSLFDRLQSIKREESIADTEAAPSLDRIRKGVDYEPIEAGLNAVDDPGIVLKPVNHDIPYKPGDPLPDTLDHIGTKTKREMPTLNNLKANAYIKTVDNLHNLNQFDKTVEKVLGRELKPSESSYTLGLNSRGSDQISKQILTEKMVNKLGDAIGPSLKEITTKVPKNKLSKFEDYLINKHAITRMERGEKVFPDEMEMNAAKSEAKVKQYESQIPEFKELSEQYYEYNNQLGKTWLVDSGILSEKQWKQYREANPNYVPNNRIFKDIEKSGFSHIAKKGFSNQSNPVKKAVGSQRKLVSPIESTIEHTDKYVKTAKRNEVMQTLINNIKQDPEAFKGWAEIVPTKETPQDVLETLQKDGVEGVLENFISGFEQKTDLTKGNVVFGLIDGQKVHVKVNDPQLLEAITNLSPQAQHIVIKAVGQVTRVMKNLTTGINPVFSLTRNIWRDIPTAFVNSKTTDNPLKFGKDLIGSVISVFKNDDLYRSFKAVGGGHSSPISSDVNLLAQSKRDVLPEKGLRNFLGKGLGALENLNNAVEAAPRLAEFKRITKNDPSYDGKMKGLYEANDITVNFNKYGNTAKEVDAVVPYLNAALQGLDKTWRSIKGQPAKFVVKGFTAVTIPTIALYAINHDDPDYNQLSDFVKDNNFLIPNGDGTFTKIPKPRELGVFFGSDVERALRMWNDDDPEAFKTFSATFRGSFTPPTRTTLHPVLRDLPANKNFMDAPIVPGDLQSLSPEYQYDSTTSEVAKGLGKLTKKSPKQIDYLFKSYGGVLAELGIPATTKNATIGNTLKQKVTADPVFSNDNSKKFYDLKTKLDQAHANYAKQGIESKDLDEELRKEMNRKSLEMGKIRKEIKEVQNDDSLSRKEKQAKARRLQQFINDLAQIPKE